MEKGTGGVPIVAVQVTLPEIAGAPRGANANMGTMAKGQTPHTTNMIGTATKTQPTTIG